MKQTYEHPLSEINTWITSDIITTSSVITYSNHSASIGDTNNTVRIGYKELFPEKYS